MSWPAPDEGPAGTYYFARSALGLSPQTAHPDPGKVKRLTDVCILPSAELAIGIMMFDKA